MKRLILVALAILVVSSGVVAQGYGVPELHKITAVTLSPSYSCRSQEESQKGYQSSALFLSDHSKRRNSPELLFNGACRSDDSLDVSGAGFDMSFIVDLGPELELEKLTAQDVFHIYHLRSSPNSSYSKYARSVLGKSTKLVVNHTYAVLLNKQEIRGLFVFTVVNHTPNRSVGLKYAVKQYQIMDVRAESPGFGWEWKNSTVQADSNAEKVKSN